MLGVGPYPLESEIDPDSRQPRARKIVTEPAPAPRTAAAPIRFAMVRGRPHRHMDRGSARSRWTRNGQISPTGWCRAKDDEGDGRARWISSPAPNASIVAMEHTTKDGGHKILKKCCALPLTGHEGSFT